MTLSREEQIFLLVLIINTVIAVIYFLVGILIYDGYYFLRVIKLNS